jgi:monofunctional glycosyltransferase
MMLFMLASCAGPGGCGPKIAELKSHYPHVIYKGPKKPSEIEIRKTPPSNWVNLSQVSKLAQGAVLVSEDWAFYQHEGFDPKQIQEAIQDSVQAGKMTRGASTITQQVAKNIFLTKQKSLTRKVREVWIATKMEKVLGKKKIFELYLNIAEWGEGVFGIERAAQVYFGKPAAQLNAKEGAFLAMLLPSPIKYSISYRKRELTSYARRTIRSIMGKMVQAKYLTLEERDAAWEQPLPFEASFNPVLNAQDNSEVGADEVVDETLDDATQKGVDSVDEPASE